MIVNMDVDLLRTYVAISEQGGFSAAAATIFRTQSAVSQQMRRLEEIVGHPLFRKEGRRRVLTPAGQNLLRYANEIVSLNDQAIATVDASLQSGEVRIGAPHDIADTVLPRYLSRLAKANPNVHVVLTVDRSPNLMPLIQEGKLDLTLTTRFSDRFEGQLLRISPTVWLCASNFRLNPLSPVPLVLADEPSIFRRIALTALEQRGVAHIERYTCPSLSSIHVALSAGLGITARTVEALTPDLKILGEDDGLPPLPDTNYYIYRKHGEMHPAAAHLYNMICAD